MTAESEKMYGSDKHDFIGELDSSHQLVRVVVYHALSALYTSIAAYAGRILKIAKIDNYTVDIAANVLCDTVAVPVRSRTAVDNESTHFLSSSFFSIYTVLRRTG